MIGNENKKKYVLEFDLKCPEDQKADKKAAQAGGLMSAAPTASAPGGP